MSDNPTSDQPSEPQKRQPLETWIELADGTLVKDERPKGPPRLDGDDLVFLRQEGNRLICKQVDLYDVNQAEPWKGE